MLLRLPYVHTLGIVSPGTYQEISRVIPSTLFFDRETFIDKFSAALFTESEEIIAHHLRKSELQQLVYSGEFKESPKFVHLCGIPGSGKTTYACDFLRANGNFALVQFDSIMEGLTGYQTAFTSLGAQQAFNLFELPARAIGYRLLYALLRNRRDILFDHSAANSGHLEILKSAKATGYSVQMHHLKCDVRTAENRVGQRELSGLRHTPISLVAEREQLLQQLIPSYMSAVDCYLPVFTDGVTDQTGLPFVQPVQVFSPPIA